MMRTLLAMSLILTGLSYGACARAAIEDEEPSVAGKKLSQWAQILRTEKDEKQRRAALTALKYFGIKLETAKSVVPVADAARDDTSEAIRKAATLALSDLAVNSRDYLDPRKTKEKKKGEIAESILKKAVEALVEELKVDKAAEVRQTAAEGLGRLGEDAWTAIEPLMNALKDRADPVRAAAAEALGRIGPKAHDAAPLLVDALKDKKTDRLLRLYSAYALGRIAPMPPDAAVAALGEALADAETPGDVRKSAADALGRLGEAAAPVVPALGAALKDKQNLELRRASANALGQVGPGAVKALPELRQAVRDEDKFVRCHALRAIGGLGKDGADAVPDLVRCLKEDSNTEARVAAIEALGSLGLNAPEAVDALSAASRSSQTVIREAALEALRKIEGK